MPNSTLISVPTKFEEPKQVRAFVLKLVEKLDIVLGYRGASGYEAAAATAELANVTLATLAEANNVIRASVDELRESIEFSQDATNQNTTAIAALKSSATVTDTAYSAPAISATYSQSEVQAIADNLQTVSGALDDLLAALRTTEIIAT